ncbi:hypothetical protein A8926_5499 [Saccharopolyspora spinosa]|uniref:Uncharacterized protein n=1 Tax=Saccharopolyspora spinosa TaxID=60894 RepID=A0A2N3Y3K9_SACSN|nr:hypothetical protein A8926_5499 [Saccharopolyspora spinosa]
MATRASTARGSTARKTWGGSQARRVELAAPSCNVMLRTAAPGPAVRKVDSYGVVTSSRVAITW